MRLVWKLLRQHISVPQFIGFFFANLFGMFIVLLGIQFYYDVLPVFTAEDSFMRADYLVVNKKVGAGTSLSGRSTTFSKSEVQDVASQPFAVKTGIFTGNEFKVTANMGVSGINVLNSEIFLQSIPDAFVDAPIESWQYEEGSREVPLILPRTYINMYNFGFAQNRSLPKISEGLVGMIDFNLNLRGNSHQDDFKGRVIGFSNRIHEILVPEAFMKWANACYAPQNTAEPSRLIIEVSNPTDETIAKFLDSKGYEIGNDNLDAEKTTYFLRLIVSLVMLIGLVISLLSFYILMLNIYLLVQKNSSKLENLLLIGYSPEKVALPYQLLTIGLNIAVLLMAWLLLWVVRSYYMDVIYTLFPQLDDSSVLPSLVAGLLLLLLVTILNQLAIRRKIMAIWKRKE